MKWKEQDDVPFPMFVRNYLHIHGSYILGEIIGITVLTLVGGGVVLGIGYAIWFTFWS